MTRGHATSRRQLVCTLIILIKSSRVIRRTQLTVRQN